MAIGAVVALIVLAAEVLLLVFAGLLFAVLLSSLAGFLPSRLRSSPVAGAFGKVRSAT